MTTPNILNIDNLVVEMVQDKETTHKIRFKEESEFKSGRVYKNPIGTLYLPKEPWIHVSRIKITVEDISNNGTE